MTVHHLLNEDTIEEKCIYCGNNLYNKKWISEFDVERHYKTVICKCGNKNWIRVNFYGSGHDNWQPNGKKIEKTKTIDDKIQKLN